MHDNTCAASIVNERRVASGLTGKIEGLCTFETDNASCSSSVQISRRTRCVLQKEFGQKLAILQKSKFTKFTKLLRIKHRNFKLLLSNEKFNVNNL